jgi:malonyl-CoA decarboxylase
MALPFSNTVDRTLERLRTAFVETARGAREVVGAPLRPDLPDDDIPRLKSRIDACLAGKGGETARRGRAAELGQAYLSLSPAGRKKFLLTLAHDYGLPREAAMATVERWRAAKEPPRALRKALEPPAIRLLHEFVGVPQGVKFVVDLRAELMILGRTDAAARMLSEDLRPLLGGWFDVGFLDLVRIDWRASAALLEKLVAYEAVHAIRSWRDLKNRLDSDRRCFAFFHPRMPDEPLIFVEVALVNGMAGNVQRLLDARAETSDPKHANTAIFYSISNCQEGLRGVSFGNFLIKQVVEELKAELPHLARFSTLSPVPTFRRWLEQRAAAAEAQDLLRPEEKAALRAAGAAEPGADPAAVLLSLLRREDWWEDPELAEVLRRPLLRLCALYLTSSAGGAGPADPVARFHLGNGARLERINWLGNVATRGIKESFGLMVNYLYDPEAIEANHEAFVRDGAVARSPAIDALLAPPPPAAGAARPRSAGRDR